MRDTHFFQNCGSFQYNISRHPNKVSWCCIENYHNFERNEYRATVFLKWTDFRTYDIISVSLAIFLSPIVPKELWVSNSVSFLLTTYHTITLTSMKMAVKIMFLWWFCCTGCFSYGTLKSLKSIFFINVYGITTT